MNNERWGIIYCPKKKVGRTHKKWEKIQQCLTQRGIAYDFVQSESRDSVGRLATMLLQNGYRRLMVVGGDNALNQLVNSVMQRPAEEIDAIKIGIIPNGFGNDFARFWEIPSDDVEKSVDVMVKERVRKVDVGVCKAKKKGEEESLTQYFLNCVNVGLVAHILNLRHKAYRFWGMSGLAYATSFLLLLFHRMENKMAYTINHQHEERSVMTFCIGSCLGYGQTPNAVPYSGMLDVSVVSQPEVLKLISGMWMLISGKFLNNKSVTPYRTRSAVQLHDLGGARVSVDGKAWDSAVESLEVSVLQERINFLIP